MISALLELQLGVVARLELLVLGIAFKRCFAQDLGGVEERRC